MPSYRRLNLAALALVLSSCAIFHPGATERDLEGSYDQVFQATLETLEARGFPLERVDRTEGVIETGKRPVDGIRPQRRVETVRAEIEREGAGEASVRLLMTFFGPQPTPGGDRNRRSSDVRQQAADRGAVYADYLDAIAARVRDLRDAAPS